LTPAGGPARSIENHPKAPPARSAPLSISRPAAVWELSVQGQVASGMRKGRAAWSGLLESALRPGRLKQGRRNGDFSFVSARAAVTSSRPACSAQPGASFSGTAALSLTCARSRRWFWQALAPPANVRATRGFLRRLSGWAPGAAAVVAIARTRGVGRPASGLCSKGLVSRT